MNSDALARCHMENIVAHPIAPDFLNSHSLNITAR